MYGISERSNASIIHGVSSASVPLTTETCISTAFHLMCRWVTGAHDCAYIIDMSSNSWHGYLCRVILDPSIVHLICSARLFMTSGDGAGDVATRTVTKSSLVLEMAKVVTERS